MRYSEAFLPEEGTMVRVIEGADWEDVLVNKRGEVTEIFAPPGCTEKLVEVTFDENFEGLVGETDAAWMYPEQLERAVNPDIWLAYIDETADVDPDIVARTGRIFSAYLYNRNEVTHCCEMTPSHWLAFVGYLTDNPLVTDDDETLEDEVRDMASGQLNASSGGMYVHYHQVEAFHIYESIPDLPFMGMDRVPDGMKHFQVQLSGPDGESESTTEDAFEGYAEYAQSNGLLST